MAILKIDNWSGSRPASTKSRPAPTGRPMLSGQNLGSSSKITTGRISVSMKPSATKATKPRYRKMVNEILADREGKETWPQLERLEALAEHQKEARTALQRLDVLGGVQDYQESEKAGAAQASELAKLLDSSSPRISREGWRRALDGTTLDKKFQLLNSSKKETGWKTLGYPPSVSKNTAAAAAPGWEDPTQWRKLVEGVVRRQVGDDEGSQEYREYRKLLAAYQHLQTNKLDGQVDETALWFDIHKMEEKLRPEQLERARKTVHTQVTDRNNGRIRVGSKGRGQRFLSSLSRMPDSVRESKLHEEFSLVSLKSPEELRGYAELLQQEAIKRGKDVSTLNPLIQKVFSKVARESSGRPVAAARVVESDAFRRLVRELGGADPMFSGAGENDKLKIYRSGLTVGGMTRNYVVSDSKKPGALSYS